MYKCLYSLVLIFLIIPYNYSLAQDKTVDIPSREILSPPMKVVAGEGKAFFINGSSEIMSVDFENQSYQSVFNLNTLNLDSIKNVIQKINAGKEFINDVKIPPMLKEIRIANITYGKQLSIAIYVTMCYYGVNYIKNRNKIFYNSKFYVEFPLILDYNVASQKIERLMPIAPYFIDEPSVDILPEFGFAALMNGEYAVQCNSPDYSFTCLKLIDGVLQPYVIGGGNALEIKLGLKSFPVQGISTALKTDQLFAMKNRIFKLNDKDELILFDKLKKKYNIMTMSAINKDTIALFTLNYFNTNQSLLLYDLTKNKLLKVKKINKNGYFFDVQNNKIISIDEEDDIYTFSSFTYDSLLAD